jgi:hypothetical protein
MRAKAGPSVEQPAAPAQVRGAQETVPAEVTIGADELNQIRMMRPHWGEYESGMPAIEADIGRRVLSDISGGRLRFNERGGIVPSKGGREISPRQAEEIIGNLERSERTYGREAIDYVTAPKRKNGRPEIGNDRGEIEVGKDETFAYALKHKIYRNNDTRGKLALGAAFTSLAPFVAGLGMAIAGTPAAGAVMLGMIPVAAISFGGLGVKYLYDKYKERKAAKDYSTASVAKGARSKLSEFLGRK